MSGNVQDAQQSQKVHLFGIRHHGPGCARALQAALATLEPDILLVEGPPDAQDVLPLLMQDTMQPPVALLIYAQDNPQQAAYYPFAHFSPEWQALRYAFQHALPARFIDLPQAVQLSITPQLDREDAVGADVSRPQPDNNEPVGADVSRPQSNNDEKAAGINISRPSIFLRDRSTHNTSHPPVFSATGRKRDTLVPTASRFADEQIDYDAPFKLLAQAAGYDDYELWWERQIEQRRDVTDLFEGILEAMVELRGDTTPRDEREARREASMRQEIRVAQKEGFQRIAVICGAWHTPALLNLDNASDDAALLRGMRKVKVAATWIPWTNSRLSFRSGYGAGITSPGWYEHLWNVQNGVSERWLTKAAHLLRAEGMDTSSASVIEATRLGETLAALRDLPMPGLAELHEAIETVLCNGNAAPMSLIRDKLEIGDRLGSVPDDTPTIPLQRDLENQQRTLRLKPVTETVTLDLDLREATGRARSHLLHRLSLLDIPWGGRQTVRGKSGTFHEIWQLQWHVEFIVTLIEKNIWGNTIESAATAYARHLADTLPELPQLTALLDQVMLSELSGAVDHLLDVVQQRAAVSADVRHLMNALPPLARVARYGDVRQTKTEHLLPVIDGLFERVLVGLPGACASLDDDAAQAMVGSINNVQESVNLLNRDEQRDEWQSMLRNLTTRDAIHGLVRGRCCRLLLEQQVLDEEELHRLARLALSPATPAPQAAAWLEGILRGNGLLLLHQNGLWRILDRWLSDLTEDDFVLLLPFLRRAFAEFQPPERRAMGEKVKKLSAPALHPLDNADRTDITPINHERGTRVMPVLAQILGVSHNGNE